MWIKNLVPNLFTLGNLFLGCLAISLAFSEEMILSTYCIGIALVFDFMDGFMARTLGVNGEFGKQLDSLADVVSFGVVPGVFMHYLLSINSPSVYLPYFGFLIPLFSALRLAKFNIDGARQSNFFIGLPVPANTMLIISLYLIIQGHRFPKVNELIVDPSFLVILTIVSCILMNLDIRLFSLKFNTLSWKGNEMRYLFLLISVPLILTLRFLSIPLIIFLYIILSIVTSVRSFRNWLD